MIRTPVHRPGPRVRGFSLLEALIALTILGASAVALLAWIQQGRDTMLRIERVREEAQLQLDARAWLRTLNPAVQREGRAELDGLSIAWTSELAAPERSENDYSGNLQPVWNIGLFRLKVTAKRGGTQVTWDQLMAGWRARDAAGLQRGSP